MAFRLTIPSVIPEHFDQTVELILQREARALGASGSTHAATLAANAAKAILKDWDVAKDGERTFGAILRGHANPGGEAPDGFANDAIEINLWRSGRIDVPVVAEKVDPKAVKPIAAAVTAARPAAPPAPVAPKVDAKEKV